MVDPMPSSRTLAALQVVPYGAAARAALRDLVVGLRAGDPLAPVTVVVPSALAGTTLRRSLARELGGLAGVAFVSLPALAEQLAAARLAADGRSHLDGLTLRALVGAVLDGDAGGFGSAHEHPATIGALADTIRELRPLGEAELDHLAGRGPRAADVVRVHRAVRRAASRWADDHDALLAATAAVDAGDAVLAEVGPVVLHLPRTLTRPELDLVAALGRRGRVHAIVGSTGRAGADAAVAAVAAALEGAGLGPRPMPGPAAGADPPVTTVVVAPDPAEEARHATRLVLDAIASGTAPERIAVVSRVREPYALLVHEELAAAGVRHSAPAPNRLTQSMAGRTLLGLLAWVPSGARRSDLVRLLRGAPLLDDEGRTARPDRWDRAARNAGVVAGLDQWRTRLATARKALADRLAEQDEVDEGGDRLESLDRLGAFVEHVAALTNPGERTGWAPLARWAERVLLTALGREGRAARWPEAEQEARAAVLDVLDRLAALQGIGPEPDAVTFRRALEHELGRGGRRVGRFGHGVTVGRLVDAVGADLDLVVVLGWVEGAFPPRRVDDALLPERERRAVAALRPRGTSRDEEERDAWAVLAAAPHAVLTTAAADPRAQREHYPAPWLVELAGASEGRDLTAAELAAAGDGVIALASFEAWLAEGGAPATPTERDVAELIAAHRAGIDVASLPFVAEPADHPGPPGSSPLARGFAAARSRLDGRFDEWAGNVGPQPLLVGEAAEHRSPTGLEAWATCPFRYFLGKVLTVRSLDDPADAETIDPRDRGILVHEVMERFVTGQLHQDPTTAWTPEARDELERIADEVESGFRGAGRTGREVLWRSEWAALRRHVSRIVEHGIGAPELAGTRPVAVEHAFGFGGEEAPAVEIGVGGEHPLRFGGRIDRIDASADGRKVVVVDYKTSSSYGFKGMKDDLLDRGRRLQLPVYALAARELVPEAEEVAAYYWFVSPRYAIELKGGVIDDEVEARFHDVLETVVGGIEDGVFPAHPGDESWLPGVGPTFDACKFCDFDRVCPGGRGERWVKLREHPSLAPYVELAEGEP